MCVCVQRERRISSVYPLNLSSAPVPPHRPDSAHVMRAREAGPRSREGRSLCGQTGQSHPEGWVLRQQRRKTHLFSLLRTRWNVMVWSRTSQGGEYPRGDRRKWFRGESQKKIFPSLSPPAPRWLSESMWMNLSSPCRQQQQRQQERVPPSAWAQTLWSCGFYRGVFSPDPTEDQPR